MSGKLKITYALLFCFYTLIQSASAQDSFIDSIQQKFNSYNQQAYTEKIYLNTDRNYYIAGEIIWFKIYIVNGLTNQLSDLSKIAYTEVLDNNNKILLQTKIGIREGYGNGSFYLPITIPSGNYKIRCYTNWMKNFDAGLFFENKISVVNTGSSGNLPVDTTVVYNADFFPEGGNLSLGIENNIAFKITDNRGTGLNNCAGIITDGNDTIVKFAPHYAGIGTFSFTPLKEHSYVVTIVNSSGQEILKKAMPTASDNFAMQLKVSANGKMGITIRSSATEQWMGKTFYLFAHTRGVIKSVQKTLFQSGTAQFTIDENKLAEGITHFTVFNDSKTPVCERLYFKRPKEKLNINISTDEQKYFIRKKAGLNVLTSDGTHQPISANMSVAVYRIDSLQNKSTSDIFSYLWLNADLIGHIENASYYLESINDNTTIGLDNLMLTHGWRRFKWKDIQQNKKPFFEFLPELEGQIITGKIIDSSNKQPFSDVLVFASVPSQHTQFYSSLSDKKGNIKFYTKNIVGPGELVVQAHESEKPFYSIEINSPFADKFSEYKLPDLNISTGFKKALEINSINAQVQRRFAADMLKKYYLPDIDTSAFYGNANERYLLDDYTRFSTMEEVLREYIPGVVVGRQNRKYKLTVFDMQNKRLFRDNPLLLLDGVAVQDAERIINYDPLKVRKIEVVTNRYYYGPLVLDGIVNFSTYKGNMEEFEMDPKAIILDFEGVQLQREFYMPVYDTPEQKNSRLADFRNLLYWNPEVVTDKNGEVTLQFYTSDIKGKYVGVIEGITKDGKAGSGFYTFEVQ